MMRDGRQRMLHSDSEAGILILQISFAILFDRFSGKSDYLLLAARPESFNSALAISRECTDVVDDDDDDDDDG
jgi:hypothetical protein